MTPALNDVNGNFVPQDPGERVKQVLVKQIKKFSGKFNASRSSTADNEG